MLCHNIVIYYFTVDVATNEDYHLVGTPQDGLVIRH